MMLIITHIWGYVHLKKICQKLSIQVAQNGLLLEGLKLSVEEIFCNWNSLLLILRSSRSLI